MLSKSPKKWRTLRKTSCYWADKYATSQLRSTITRTVNTFLLAYLIRVNLWQKLFHLVGAKEYLIAAM